ncbi:hypothetical protein D3C83_228910 [compost metagenome]
MIDPPISAYRIALKRDRHRIHEIGTIAAAAPSAGDGADVDRQARRVGSAARSDLKAPD